MENRMKITSSLTKPSQSKSDAIIAAAYSDEKHNSTMQEIDQLVDGQISKLTTSKDFKANAGEVLTLFTSNGKRIVVVGLGKKNKCDLGTLQTASTNAIKALASTPANTASNYMTSLEFNNTDNATACKVIAIAASHAAYRYETTKNFKKDDVYKIESMDSDPEETQEWLDALSSVLKTQGAERVQYLLQKLSVKLTEQGSQLPYAITTPYRNTIPVHKEARMPGDLFVERNIRSLIRWNAMAMVMLSLIHI